MSNKYSVSIIIPTYNEEADIRRTLDACVSLRYPYKETIVVDDSTDNTPNIVKDYEKDGVRLIHRAVNSGGRSGARNVGIGEARGNLLVILNADVFPGPDFLDRLVPHYERGADYVLVESCVANQEKLFPRFVEAQYHYSYDGQDWIEWTEGFSCRKEAAVAVGMFPSSTGIPLCAGEDGFFGTRLNANGYRKVIDRSIVVYHSAPDSFSGNWKARKEKCSPVTSYFLHRTPLWKLSIKACLRTIFLLSEILLIAPALIKAHRITRFSPKGRRDLFAFFYAYSVQSLAFLAGEWQGLVTLFRYTVAKAKKKSLAGPTQEARGKRQEAKSKK